MIVIYELTARELEIVKLIDAGRTFQEIGDTLKISPRTAKMYTDQLRWKLGVSKKRNIPTVLRQLGIID